MKQAIDLLSMISFRTLIKYNISLIVLVIYFCGCSKIGKTSKSAVIIDNPVVQTTSVDAEKKTVPERKRITPPVSARQYVDATSNKSNLEILVKYLNKNNEIRIGSNSKDLSMKAEIRSLGECNQKFASTLNKITQEANANINNIQLRENYIINNLKTIPKSEWIAMTNDALVNVNNLVKQYDEAENSSKWQYSGEWRAYSPEREKLTIDCSNVQYFNKKRIKTIDIPLSIINYEQIVGLTAQDYRVFWEKNEKSKIYIRTFDKFESALGHAPLPASIQNDPEYKREIQRVETEAKIVLPRISDIDYMQKHIRIFYKNPTTSPSKPSQFAITDLGGEILYEYSFK